MQDIFKKISEQSPQLFAVKPDKTIWYHDENGWHQYKTAEDVKYDSKPVEDDSEPGFGEQDGAESFSINNQFISLFV